MSDAISDDYRDQRRDRYFKKFLETIIKLKESPSVEKRMEVIRAAEETDDVPRGLMSGKSNLCRDLEERLDRLLANDKKEWAKLLFEAQTSVLWSKLKTVSPFAGKLLVFVNYGVGFVNLRGSDLQYFFDGIIGGERDLKVYDGDRYLVVLPEPDNGKDAQVEWISCVRYGAKGPRPNK